MSKEKDYIVNRIEELNSNRLKLSKSDKIINLFDGERKEIDGWDLIFQEIECSLHSELPNRVKNWLINKFYSPVKK